MDERPMLQATEKEKPVYLNVITFIRLSLLYAWQELLPSMKDVYGVELEEPKKDSMKDYERYCMPCGGQFFGLYRGSLTETKDERTER